MSNIAYEKGRESYQPGENPGSNGNGASQTAKFRFGLVSALHLADQLADRAISAYDRLFSLDEEKTAKIYMGMGADYAHDGKSDPGAGGFF